MTTETETTFEAETDVAPAAEIEGASPTKTRPALTPEQRAQKNARDRERRAAQSAAKAQIVQQQTAQSNLSRDHSAAPHTTFEGTIGQQQAQRDKPYQQALSASLQAQDKARAARIRASQQRQPDRKHNDH